MNQLSLGALLVHKHWQQQRIPFMQQTFILPHSNFTPNHPPCSWDEERTNGRRAQEFKSLGREQKELAAFRVKSCLHPLCCKIRFLCFLKANAPGNISAFPGAQSQPAPALLLRAAPLSHLGAGWRKVINACKHKAARSWVPLTLYPESRERQEGFHCTCLEITPCKPFRLLDILSMSCSQQLPAGRWDERGCSGKRERLGSTIPTQLWQESSSRSLHKQGWLSGRSVPGSGAWC